MIRKVYGATFILMISSMFYYVFASENPQTTITSEPIVNPSHWGKDKGSEQIIASREAADQVAQQILNKSFASADEGANAFADFSPSEVRLVEEYASVDKSLKEDQAKLLNLQQTFERVINDNIAVANGANSQNDINEFNLLIEVSLAGQILRIINKRNKHKYSQYPTQKKMLLCLNSRGQDVFQDEFKPNDLRGWTLQLIMPNQLSGNHAGNTKNPTQIPQYVPTFAP